MRRLLPLFLIVPAFAPCAVTNVRVLGTTSTQAVLAYTAPDTSACTIEVSASQTFSPLAHDVDPALFSGANLDSRPENVTAGRQRIFVVGRRTADQAADGNRYSRALQADTIHYFRIHCGSDLATGTFATTNIPLGNTAPETYPTDPAAPGEYAWPTVDWNDQSKEYIDPQTGVLLKRLTSAWPLAASAVTNASIAYEVNPSTWTTPANAALVDTNWASYAGTNQDPVFIRLPEITLGGGTRAQMNDWNNAYWSLQDIQITVKAYCSTANCVQNAAGERNVDLCLSVNGVSCASAWKTITVGTSANDAAVSYPSDANFRTPGLQKWWTDAAHRPIPSQYIGTRGGTATVNGTSVVWASGDLFPLDHWANGTRIQLNGSECTIASVQNEKALTLASPCGSTGPYLATDFGILLRKSTSSADTLNVNGVTFRTAGAAQYEMPAAGESDYCDATPHTDSSGNIGYLCGIGADLIFIVPATGEVRIIAYLHVNGGMYPNMQLADCAVGNMLESDPADLAHPHFYCTPVRIGDSTFKYLIRGTYHSEGVSGCSDPADFQAVPDPSVPNCNVTWELLSSNVSADIAAFEPAYSRPQAVYLSPAGKHGKYIVFFMYNAQDTGMWVALYDTERRAIVSVFNTWSKYPCRWCAGHSILPTGPGTFYPVKVMVKDMPGNTTTLAGRYVTNLVGALPVDRLEPCPADLDSRWIAFGATGNNCATIDVAGDVCDVDPSSWEQANLPVCPWNPSGRFLQPVAEGDVFWIDLERFLIVRVLSSTKWIVLRNFRPRHGIAMTQDNLHVAAHADGVALAMACSMFAGNGYFWVEPTDSHGDHGLNDLPMSPTAHGDVSNDTTLMWNGAGYSVRRGSRPNQITQMPGTNIGVGGSFAGTAGISIANSLVQTHISFRQAAGTDPGLQWFLDFNPLGASAGGATALWNFSVNPLGGDLYRVTAAGTPSRKKLPMLGYAGRYALRDVSGPGSSITGASSDQWKMCIADFAGECYSGSTAGDIYVNVPKATISPATCQRTFSWHTPCVASIGAELGYAWQVGLAKQSNRQFSRRITSAFQYYGATNTYSNLRSLPDGSWAILGGTYLNGIRSDYMLAKLPPYPAAPDSQNRNTFVRVPVQVASPPPGTSNVVVEFGYNTSLFCTSRSETCVATQATVSDANPFYFASETYSGAGCVGGCKITVPALPQRVLYYRTRYRKADGTTVATGQMQVLAIP
jgi:hypothetical protein